MSLLKGAFLVSLSVFMSAVYAQGEERAQVELGSSLETFNKSSYSNWRSNYIDVTKKLGDRKSVYGSLRETDRFNVKDSEWLAGGYLPLSSRWTLLTEGNASPSHNILARWSALSQLQYALDDGWGIHFGVRHTVYNSALINTMLLTGERYWSDYRAAYTHSESALADAGSAPNDRIQLSRYYGENNFIGTGYSHGSEIENFGLPLGILSTRVQSIGLNGRHWLSRDWAASYEFAITEQGNFYTRNTFRLGLRRQF